MKKNLLEALLLPVMTEKEQKQFFSEVVSITDKEAKKEARKDPISRIPIA